MELPRRTSLAQQTAESLRKAIWQGEWTKFLPGEHALSEHLKVSRTTLRIALSVLRREGLIDVSQGQRVRIVSRPERGESPSSSKVVGVLAGQPYYDFSWFSLHLITKLQDDLAEIGYKLEVHAEPRFGARHPSRSLTHLLNSAPADTWVLLRPTEVCLQWFTERNVRAISVMDTPEDRTIRSVYVHSAAAAAHAVRLFLKRGYARVVLLSRDVEAPGRASLERAFTEAAAAANLSTYAKSLVVRYAPGVEAIQKALDSIVATNKDPIGILVAVPRDVITVMCHLANSGVRVPQQVGLISLGYFPQMDALLPSVAHYASDWKRFAKRLSTAVRTLVTVGELPQRQIGILPEFQEGDSLAQVGRETGSDPFPSDRLVE